MINGQAMTRNCASAELVRGYPNADPDAARRVVRASRSSRLLGRQLAELATEHVPVLLLGETGTGKTLLARELHPTGSDRTLVTLNCASLGETQLAQVVYEHLPLASTSAAPERRAATLFMDEIGELSPWAQAVLLRALTGYSSAEGPRIVAATHRDLEAMVRAGSFSGELLLRLRGATLRVLPLRERSDEIAPLALHFLRLELAANDCSFVSLEPRVLSYLEKHAWPGNVRELQNSITSAYAVCGAGGYLGVEALPEELRALDFDQTRG
jgi:DNA-binding NtrC family response regulator